MVNLRGKCSSQNTMDSDGGCSSRNYGGRDGRERKNGDHGGAHRSLRICSSSIRKPRHHLLRSSSSSSDSSSSSVFFYALLFCMTAIAYFPATCNGRPLQNEFGAGFRDGDGVGVGDGAGSRTERKTSDAGYGFVEIGRFSSVEDWNVTAVHYRHSMSGAQFVSVSNHDPIKYFAVALKTLPTDDYGVAHVLEHSVLSGSAKYPVHNLIQEIVKYSFADVNAYTSNDYTAYHCTASNTKDLYNILDVWWDSIFHPSVLTEELIFLREGWSYNLESPNDTLTLEGVVMNEMKWSFSSDDYLRRAAVRRAAFPNTTYAHVAGGDPFQMTNLTYESLKDFHQKFYHPSNSLTMMYGDDNPEDRLRFLGGLLSNFTQDPAVEIQSALQPMAENGMPRSASETYLTNAENESNLNIIWILDVGAALDVEKRAELAVLFLILRLILPSQFPSNDVSVSLEIDTYQSPILTVEIKNSSSTTSPSLLDGVMGIMESLSRGLPAEVVRYIDALAKKTQIDDLEMSDSNGDDIFFDMVAFWKRGGDPLQALNRSIPQKAAYEKIISSEGVVLEDLIKDLVISNGNRILVDIIPSSFESVLSAQNEINRQLSQWKSMMSPEQIELMVNKTKELDEFVRPRGAIANSILPSLAVKDLNLNIPTENDKVQTIQGVKVIENYLETNGIFYFDVAFNLGNFRQDLLPYAAALCSVWKYLRPVNTTGNEYFRLNVSVASVSASLEFYDGGLKEARGKTNGSAYLQIGGKSLSQDAPELVNMIHTLLLNVELNAPEVFYLLDGSGYWTPPWSGFLRKELQSRLGAKDNIKGWFQDVTDGYRASLTSTEITDATLSGPLSWEAKFRKIKEAYSLMVHSGAASISLIGDASTIASVYTDVMTLITSLPLPPIAYTPHFSWVNDENPSNESVLIPLLVYGNSRSRNVYKGGWTPSGSGHVITEVQSAWINTVIRSRRHAYGGGAKFEESTGLVAHLSWADPRIVRSLQAFDESANYLMNVTETDEDLPRIVAAQLGRLNDISAPYDEGMARFVNFLTNVTAIDYKTTNEEILATSFKDFQNFGVALRSSISSTVVAASPKALEDAAQMDPALNFQTLISPYIFLQ